MTTTQATRTALVVDDEQSIRLGFSVALRSIGFEVLTAEDGNVGIDLAFIHNPHCVVLDLRMPGPDGISVASRLRESGYLQPVILASAFADHEGAIQSMRAGVVDFLTKPVKPSELRYAVNHAIDRQNRFDPAGPAAIGQVPTAQLRAFAKYCISQQKFDIAKAALDRTIQSVHDLQSHLLIGAIHEIQGDMDKAAQAFLHAADYKKNSSEGSTSLSLFKVFSHSDNPISD